jgi:hypothetical protein
LGRSLRSPGSCVGRSDIAPHSTTHINPPEFESNASSPFDMDVRFRVARFLARREIPLLFSLFDEDRK